MHRDRGILVGVRRLDLRGQRKFGLQRLPDREQLPGKGGDGGFGHALPRHDVVREADGLDLLLRLVRRAAEGAGGNFGGLIGRMVLRDRLRRVDGEEGRRAAVAHRGRDRIRCDLAVDRARREIGVGLLVADRLGGLVGRKLDDLDLAGIDAVLLQDHLEQIDIGLGAADHADATSGELRDLGDFRARLLALDALPAGGTHSTATFLRSVATACAFFGTSRSPRMMARSALPSRAVCALAMAPRSAAGAAGPGCVLVVEAPGPAPAPP